MTTEAYNEKQIEVIVSSMMNFWVDCRIAKTPGAVVDWLRKTHKIPKRARRKVWRELKSIVAESTYDYLREYDRSNIIGW